jgi:inosose dehydratase
VEWKVGHTGITWPSVEEAIRDTGELGYLAFETFGKTIEEWQGKPGGLKALLDQHGLPMMAAYCYATWIDPGTREEEISAVVRQARLLTDLGGRMVVLQAWTRPREGYTPEQFRALAAAFDEVGRRLADLGVGASIHPHTGTAIETREEIQTILDLVDPSLVGFAPDTGQIAKGGSDIVEVFETYRDRITHVHLKDWCGKVAFDEAGKEIDHSGYANYEPVGNGVLPIPRLLGVLEGAGYAGWLAVELDGTRRAPRPPREAAAMSRRYLGEVLGDGIVWRRAI